MRCMVYCKDTASTLAQCATDLLGLQFSGRGKRAPAFAVSGMCVGDDHEGFGSTSCTLSLTAGISLLDTTRKSISLSSLE